MRRMRAIQASAMPTSANHGDMGYILVGLRLGSRRRVIRRLLSLPEEDTSMRARLPFCTIARLVLESPNEREPMPERCQTEGGNADG